MSNTAYKYQAFDAAGKMQQGQLHAESERDAIRLLDRIIDSGRLGVARRAHWLVKRICRWAEIRDEIEMDPLSGLPCPIEKVRRERVLSHDELRLLWPAWDKQGYPFGPMQRLILLTAVRRNEASEMEWSELDDPEAPTAWAIPGSRTKNGRAHRLPLSQPARDLLRSLPRWGGPHVFSTQDGHRPVSGFSKAKDRTNRLAAELADDGEPLAAWGLHDLRRTVRTEMARLGIADAVAEKVLNHTAPGLIETYNRHAYDAEMADAFERWGAELLRIVGEREAEGNVLRIGAAK